MPVQAVRKSAVGNPVLKECSMCTRPPFCQVLQFEASFKQQDPDKIQKVKIENPIENFLLMPLFG